MCCGLRCLLSIWNWCQRVKCWAAAILQIEISRSIMTIHILKHVEDQNLHSDINCPDKQLQIISRTRRRQYLQWTKKFNESERNNVKLIWFPFFSLHKHVFHSVLLYALTNGAAQHIYKLPPLHRTAARIKAQSSEMDKQKQFWRDNFKNKSVLTLQWINLAPPAVALLLSPARSTIRLQFCCFPPPPISTPPTNSLVLSKIKEAFKSYFNIQINLLATLVDQPSLWRLKNWLGIKH